MEWHDPSVRSHQWNIPNLAACVLAVALGVALPAGAWPIVLAVTVGAFGFYCLSGELDRLGGWQRWVCPALVALAFVAVVIDFLAVHELFGDLRYG